MYKEKTREKSGKSQQLLKITDLRGKGFSSSQGKKRDYSLLFLKPNDGSPLGESCVMNVCVSLQEAREVNLELLWQSPVVKVFLGKLSICHLMFKHHL